MADYYIIYDGNGNTGGTAPIDPNGYPPGSVVEVLGPSDLIKDGYTIGGWSTEPDSEDYNYYFGDTVTIADSDITLYAFWVKLYYVTYDGNGNTSGTAPVDPNGYLSETSIVALEKGDIEKDSSTFLGWSTDAVLGTPLYLPYDYIWLTEDLTLYAIWEGPPPSYVGGLIALNNGSVVTDSYWDTETSGQSASDGGTRKNSTEMKIQETFENWDFQNVWKIDEGVEPPQFLIADFSVSTVSGVSPLEVTFTNNTSGWPSTNAMIINRSWDFGDGSPFSSDLNPIHVYQTPGIYTVTLIESRNFIEVSRTKVDLITVVGGVDELFLDFVADKRSGYQQLTVSFTNLTVGSVDNWLWDFGDGHKSVEKNPTHFYNRPGIYSVTLKAYNLFGEYIAPKLNYIIVNSTVTYDIALEPDKGAYLWGSGVVIKRKYGMEIKVLNR